MRDLLEPLAPKVDVDAGWAEVARCLPRETRRRRALRVTAVAASLAVVAGAGVLIAKAGSQDETEAPVAPPPTTTPAPDGELAVDLLPGWQRAAHPLTPDLEDPREVLAVGTYELEPNGPEVCAHVPGQALADLGDDDAFVWVARRAATGPAAATPLDDLVLPTRPEGDREIAACTPGADPFAPGFAYSWGAYERDGVSLYVLVALGSDASDATRAETQHVLDSLDPNGTALRTYVDRANGVTARYPASWHAAGNLTAPIRQPFDTRDQFVAFGTYELRPSHLDCEGSSCHADCPLWPERALREMGSTDALIWLDEIRPGPATDYFGTPRPTPFTELPRDRTDDCPDLGRDVREVFFAAAGRFFTLDIALGDLAPQRVQDEALDIINSLRFS